MGSDRAVPVKIGYSLAATSSYEVGFLLEPSMVEIGIQLSHSHSTTGLVGVAPYEVELATWWTSLLLFTRVSVQGQLSPFIEGGMGIGQFRFSKDYSQIVGYNDHGIDNAVCSMIGGGLTISLSQYWQLDALIQIMFLHRIVTMKFFPQPYYLDTPAKMAAGLRFGYVL